MTKINKRIYYIYNRCSSFLGFEKLYENCGQRDINNKFSKKGDILKDVDFSLLYQYDYSLIHQNGVSYLMLFYPYVPLEVKPDQIFIDNYYPAFQSLRKSKLKIKDFLLSKGYEVEAEQGVFKPIAMQSGKVCVLRNNLMYHKDYGTYFVMEILRIKGEYGSLPKTSMKSLCTNCNLCVEACKNGCLKGGFEKEKCIRFIQEKEEDFSQIGEVLKNLFWGCNACQTACPLNDKKPQPSSAEYLDPYKMFQLSIQGKKALQQVYGSILGDNYIRPRKLLALSIVALANCNRFDCKDQVLEFENHPDERVRNAVKYFLSRLNKEVEREHKVLLSPFQYQQIIQNEKVEKEIFQRNYYFVSSTLPKGYVVRIREKKGEYTLTVKEHLATQGDINTVNEFNYPISQKIALDYIENGFDLSAHHPTSSLKCQCVGYTDTLRKVIDWKGIVLEVDYNKYNGIEDYEIECEITTAKQDEIFYSFLEKYSITPTLPKAKYFRFLDSL
ncbi:MAG: CYTH domain-containing protein [Clostridia bacterium]|nr:CYTH domain-containing protein [Clostridia bacterium]